MAIHEIANKAYICLQSDIDIWYGTPEKGATYFCEDSGAIYIGKRYIDDEQYPLCFVLHDIINKKDRKVNPICRSQDLKNFAGKQYMITDFYRDVLFDALPYEVKDEEVLDLIHKLNNDDLLIITADHGCDPTMPGTDHSREQVPVLVYGKNFKAENLGVRKTFADISATILQYLGIENNFNGTPF